MNTGNLNEGERSKLAVKYDDVSWTDDLASPADFMLYDAKYVLQALDMKGFDVQAKLAGDWNGNKSSGIHDYQDRILSIKR